jgi:hypothetical protein
VSRVAILAKAATAAHDLANALAELASAGDAPHGSSAFYDSTHLPPRTTRRRFAELCRSGRVAGAYREGRNWVCSCDAWHAVRARRPRTTPASDGAPALAERVDELLRRRGLRLPSSNEPGRR